MATMVVQFGLATMPFRMEPRAPAVTSGTTKGTSGSILQAEELSTTTAPAPAKRGASSREEVAPLENRAMSSPARSAVAASSTITSSPRKDSRRPAERCDANSRRSSRGEVPLVEDGAHHRPHLAGCTDDSHTHGHSLGEVGVATGGAAGRPAALQPQSARDPAAQASSKAA